MTLATQEKQEQIVRYETERGEVALSTEMVRRLWCPTASPAEAYVFIQLCRFHKLNPHLKEAYIVKYDTRDRDAPASFIIGKEAWLSRAEQHPKYEGFKAGIILLGADDLIYRPSAFRQSTETLLGGWCEVYRTDRREPVRIEVALQEYDKGRSLWNSHKSTMIRKVAISQAHREAFPGMFSGLYEQAEISDEGPLNEDMVIESTGAWLPADNVDPATGEIVEPADHPYQDREAVADYHEPANVSAPPKPQPKAPPADPPRRLSQDTPSKASDQALRRLNDEREKAGLSVEEMAEWIARPENYDGKTARQLTDSQIDQVVSAILNQSLVSAEAAEVFRLGKVGSLYKQGEAYGIEGDQLDEEINTRYDQPNAYDLTLDDIQAVLGLIQSGEIKAVPVTEEAEPEPEPTPTQEMEAAAENGETIPLLPF